jgi:hypothetical protein
MKGRRPRFPQPGLELREEANEIRRRQGVPKAAIIRDGEPMVGERGRIRAETLLEILGRNY